MRIACIQMEITDRPKTENLSHAENLLAGAKGADLVLLPEVWNIGYFSFERYREESEPPGGETTQRMSAAAKELGTFLLAGSWIIREGDAFYNTSLLFNGNGEIVAQYRKIHLLGYGSREREILTRGDRVVTIKTDLAVFGLTTCYDLRFPELYRKMTDEGAEIFLVVSGWPYSRLEHWVLFNRIRALENLAFLASANAAGINGGQKFGGHSMVVDPWGAAVAEGGDGEEVVWADIDPGMVAGVRKEFPALNDRVFPT